MADSKITALTALTAADPANDMIPIVDVSDTPPASGNTKRISINNLLACSPSATLASATITGDLTVDTNVLKVDTTNNRVGIGTATPGVRFDILSDNNTSLAAVLRVNSNNAAVNTALAYDGLIASGGMTLQSGANPFIINTNGANERYRIAGDGVATWSNVGGVAGTAMTLNSTGLGVGVTPYASWPATSKALQLGASSAIEGRTNDGSRVTLYSNTVWNGTNLIYQNTAVAAYYQQAVGVHSWHTSNNTPSAGNTATFTQAMTLDASGNLLVGTTSTLAAWATKLVLSTNSGTTKWAVGPYADPNNFIISASGSFGVYLNGTSAVSWTGISDERLKDIIEPISNAVAKVGKLRSVIGKFKADETNTRRSFLLAQDVQAVLPEAVDASNPDRLGVAYTDVIPLLVAAIKELTARVQTLEAK